MTTMITDTVRITIDAPFDEVVADLADPITQPEWATEFFSGPARPGTDGEALVNVPAMGGEARLRIEADVAAGNLDLFLAPKGAPFGPPLPVRVVPNGEGVDVLYTLARMPGQPDAAWDEGLVSMGRELENLKTRLEG